MCGKWQISTKDFAKECTHFLASIAIAKALIFCNAMANAQYEQTLIKNLYPIYTSLSYPQFAWDTWTLSRLYFDIYENQNFKLVVTGT